ncbi:hypothetical protein IFR05_013261 [Cadophora sp. M221]|nr:hypothetical protein IFR05_013261 [Cadophora sp. M221]
MMPANYIAERNAKDAQQEFIGKFVKAAPDIVSFVDNCLGWNETGEFLQFFKGSFNLSVAVRNSMTNERVIIRFPIPGKVYDLWRAKKVKDEVSEGEAGKQKFLDLFEPRKEQFIEAMERVEARSARPTEEPLLAARMRDSWDSGRFWFNLASRNSVDVDQIYWQILHKEGLGEAMLDTTTLVEEEFLERKEVQFKAYLAMKQSDMRFDE